MSVPIYTIRARMKPQFEGNSEVVHLFIVVDYLNKRCESFFGFASIDHKSTLMMTFTSREAAQEYIDDAILSDKPSNLCRTLGWPKYDNSPYADISDIRVEKIGAVNV